MREVGSGTQEMVDTPYNSEFFQSQMDGSFRSALVMLPFVLNRLPINSAVDVGCGVGPWAAACLHFGVTKVLGIDGSYVDKSNLMIPHDCFQAVDLGSIDRSHTFGNFDLAICLEVAEHLAEERAETFISFLVKQSNVILFSAAIPQQGGTHHVNEQWQSYWGQIFEKFNYKAYDFIRPRVWANQHVEYWYRQNTILYINQDPDALTLHQEFKSFGPASLSSLDIVHPELYQKKSSYLHEARERVLELERVHNG